MPPINIHPPAIPPGEHKMTRMLIALTTIGLLGVLALPAIPAPMVPAPGFALLHNTLSPSNGCDGGIAFQYMPKVQDREFGLRYTVDESTCAVVATHVEGGQNSLAPSSTVVVTAAANYYTFGQFIAETSGMAFNPVCPWITNHFRENTAWLAPGGDGGGAYPANPTPAPGEPCFRGYYDSFYACDVLSCRASLSAYSTTGMYSDGRIYCKWTYSRQPAEEQIDNFHGCYIQQAISARSVTPDSLAGFAATTSFQIQPGDMVAFQIH